MRRRAPKCDDEVARLGTLAPSATVAQCAPGLTARCLSLIGYSGRACSFHRPRAIVDSRTKGGDGRSEEHTSELQSLAYLVCRLLLEKKNGHRRPGPPRAAAREPTA